MNTTPGVTALRVPNLDDGYSSSIPVTTGFPIGNSNQSLAFVSKTTWTNIMIVPLIISFSQVGTNGIISFQQPFTHHIPFLFPSEFTFVSSAFLLAPFWSDVDITTTGSVQYEVHTGGTDSFISQVSSFIADYYGRHFIGEWLLVAQWSRVPPYPGDSSIVVGYNYNAFSTLLLQTFLMIVQYLSSHCHY